MRLWNTRYLALINPTEMFICTGHFNQRVVGTRHCKGSHWLGTYLGLNMHTRGRTHISSAFWNLPFNIRNRSGLWTSVCLSFYRLLLISGTFFVGTCPKCACEDIGLWCAARKAWFNKCNLYLFIWWFCFFPSGQVLACFSSRNVKHWSCMWYQRVDDECDGSWPIWLVPPTWLRNGEDKVALTCGLMEHYAATELAVLLLHFSLNVFLCLLSFSPFLSFSHLFIWSKHKTLYDYAHNTLQLYCYMWWFWLQLRYDLRYLNTDLYYSGKKFLLLNQGGQIITW